MNRIQSRQSHTQSDQTEIMDQQTEIMARQQELMEARYTPYLSVGDITVLDMEPFSLLKTPVRNQGEGLAINLTLVTNFQINDGPNVLKRNHEQAKPSEPAQSQSPLYTTETHYKGRNFPAIEFGESLKPGERKDFLVKPRYGLKIRSDDDALNMGASSGPIDRLFPLLQSNNVKDCTIRFFLYFQDMIGTQYSNPIYAMNIEPDDVDTLSDFIDQSIRQPYPQEIIREN